MDTTTRRTSLLLLTAIAASGLLAFRTGLEAGFLSDAFIFRQQFGREPLTWVLGHYIPQRHIPGLAGWYRPTTELVYWLEVRAFGDSPLGYHLVALGCHVTTALLLALLAFRLTTSRIGALVAGLAFVLSLHAQEVVYDIADLHHALAGVALSGTLLAHVIGRRWWALGLAMVAFTVDENALLIVPLVALYEATLGAGGLRGRARRVTPFAALSVAYAAWRIGVTRALPYNEVGDPCRSPECIGNGVAHYWARLWVRPDTWRADIWRDRIELALIALVGVALVLAIVQPWRWERRGWGAFLFGFGWALGALLFSVLTLYPYVTDRFLYVADAGLAVMLGAAAAAAAGVWQRSYVLGRAPLAVAGLVIAFWLGMAVPMLERRGELYVAASEQAQGIIESTVALNPDPAPKTLFLYRDLPLSYTPAIPPGNTGPHVFNNGIGAAITMRYGRPEIYAADMRLVPPDMTLPEGFTVVVLDVAGNGVQLGSR